jgi:hypothetical protein
LAYIGASPGNVAKIDYFYTAAASQTIFSGPDNNNNLLNINLGNVDVYINGILISDQNYSVLSNSVTFNNALTEDDVVTIRSFGTFDVADTYSKGEVYTTEKVEDMTSQFRNKIINGDFDIWQRATSQTAAGYGSADRWKMELGTGAAITMSRQDFTLGQTDVPGNPKHYVRLDRTTTGTSDSVLAQRIEGLSKFSGKTITQTFWAKASSAMTLFSFFQQNYGTGGSPTATSNIHNTTFSITTSWQKFTRTLVVDDFTGDTLGTDGNDFLEMRMVWNTANNAIGQLEIAHVSVVVGDATNETDPFSPRHISVEQTMCDWYYKILGGDGHESYMNLMRVTDASNIYEAGIYHGRMRTTPTATITYTDMHKPYALIDTIASNVVYQQSFDKLIVRVTPTTDSTNARVGRYTAFKLTLDAEL